MPAIHFAEILSNRRFLVFLAAADLEFIVIITSLSFYANYATQYFNAIPAAIAAGLFVACIYAGSITVNIFLGALNYLEFKAEIRAVENYYHSAALPVDIFSR